MVAAPGIAIIGAGPGGLAAAMQLAAAGADVDVYEQADRPGGRSRRLQLGDYRFDTGPTFFLYPRILEEIFEACGARLRDRVELVRLDPLYRLLFQRADGQVPDELTIWSDPARLRASIAALAPADALQLDAFLADNRAKLAAFEPVLAGPFDTLRTFLRPDVVAALQHLRPWASVDQDLARWFRDPRVRLAFSFQSKYLGMSPHRCPSLFTILSFLEHEHGVWHPMGGCHAVIEAMADVAQAMGVRIHYNQPVRAIAFEGRRAVGVHTEDGARAATAVVVNADFAHAMRHLVPDGLRRRWTDSRIASKRFSCSTFMLYLGIEGAVDLDHHTIVLAADYAGNLAAIDAGTAPPEDPSFYIHNASVTDPTLAPPGHSALYVLAPVGNLSGGIAWEQWTGQLRAQLLEQLERLGIRDIAARIRVERIITPQDWADDFAIHHGATFNLAHSIDQMLVWRPHNRFEDLDRVYLVGGGTHPGSGLPVIFEGARITCRLIADDLGFAPAPLPRRRPMAQSRRTTAEVHS